MKIRCPRDPLSKAKGHYHEVGLGDDGTMDTVIEVDGREFRFDGEYASSYRRRDGSMTERGVRELARECLEDVHTETEDAEEAK